jgi:protein-L-isoaspartate(D-aspartate) O-methyltransferase
MDVPDWSSRAATMADRQIRARGVRNLRVLAAMSNIPRHLFVPEEEAESAYEDRPIAIGLNQTISQPYIVGYMTELLEVEPFHRVLELGTGSGYQTAILASLAREVYTIDIHRELSDQARNRLDSLGFANVFFDVRDGHSGWPERAPFDRIIVTAGAASIPSPLVEQLAASGRMVIPVGPAFDDQVLELVVKESWVAQILISSRKLRSRQLRNSRSHSCR